MDNKMRFSDYFLVCLPLGGVSYCIMTALIFHQQRGFAAGAVFMECCLIGLWNLGCFFKALRHLHDHAVMMGEIAGWAEGRKLDHREGRSEAKKEAWAEQDRQWEAQRQARHEADQKWQQTCKDILTRSGLASLPAEKALSETAAAPDKEAASN